MGSGDFIVPAGHKVVVIGPSPGPFLARAESGIWILNFGDGKNRVHAIAAVEGFVAKADKVSVIWILQAEFLDALSDLDGFLARVRAVLATSNGRVGHTAVFVTKAAERTDIMLAFRLLGLGVHLSAPDGACFVEVHRPDGIVVGMPGKAFDVGAS